MGFIQINDYRAIATDADLDVLSDQNAKIIEQCNKIAIDEAKAYIASKFDVVKIFLSPTEFNAVTPYSINDRIYVVDTGTTEVTHYHCIATGNTEYTGTTISGETYTGATIDNTTYFQEGDLRDNKLLEVVMSMSLFYIHKRLSPNNIPLFRSIAYDGNGNLDIMSSLKWLGLIQNGSLTPYNWILKADDTTIKDPEYNEPIDLLGNDPAVGLMWGNEKSAGLNDYFYHYNNIPDPNLIIRTSGTTNTTI